MLFDLHDSGLDYIDMPASSSLMRNWYHDRKLSGVLNHQAKSHMKDDLLRYFYLATASSYYGRLLKLADFPIKLLPVHKNVMEGVQGKMFSDRFRVQQKGISATTITSHLAKDGHYFIHYDPLQCRCLTVREAARIQTFPDNYYFTGSRTAQYIQVGNAVPPYLAYQIASCVRTVLKEQGTLVSYGR